MIDEIELARRLIAGDASALDEFIEAFRGKLFQYSFLMCGHRDDAEEVAQETLLKVFERFHQLREPEHIRAWVFRIAKNVCSLRRRKSVFAPAAELSLDELKPVWRDAAGERQLEIADWSALPEDLAMRGQIASLLQSAIAELPDIYKSVILLRDVEELSTGETAGALEVTEDVVKTRLHRARLAVRQKLDAALRAAREAA